MIRPAAVGALLWLATVALAGDPVDWTAAPSCAGRECTVHGRVAATAVDGRVVRLFFDGARHDVSVALVRGWLNDFPAAPEMYYRDKDIEVTGVVRRFHQQTEVVVKEAAAIQIVGTQSGPRADDRPADPGEVQELREQVHRLEKRLDELERQPPRP